MNVYGEAKEFLKLLLRYDCVEGEASCGAPFGKGIASCLDVVLKKMEAEGFATKNGDGFYGYGEVGRGGLFGVLNHIDTVPIGEGWTHDPLGAEEVDGRIYGRGALDDKGPFVAAFFAAVKLLREGRTPKRRLRFIVGCDEESGWKCMDRYVEREEMPEEGISPDGDFPVINCEKGIVYHTVKLPLPDGVISFTGGERANMVPAYAEALIDGGALGDLSLEGADGVERNGGAVKVSVRGKSAHGSHPEEGDNAVIKLMKLLKPKFREFALLSAALGESDGKGIDFDVSDKKSGALTMNLGAVRTEGGELVCELDVRHPVTFDKDEVTAALKRALPYDVEQGFYHLPLYVAEDNPLVVTLLKAYNTVTGENARPLAIGGGTYARVLPLGVAFGPCFPGGNNGMHCADEYMDLNDFDKMIDIYYLALKELCFD